MIIPLILSGGSGTRLWPLSRKLYPKQFLSLASENSLFQDSLMRLPSEARSPVIICNEDHRFIVAEQLRQINCRNNGIILEPIGKNTAPAIALAAIDLLTKYDDPILLVLSADHIIKDELKFHNSINIATEHAKSNKLVSIGIHPEKPEVGFGYIEVDKSKEDEFYKIISFTEKPSLQIAETYLESGNYYWNSGIFVFKASVYLKELKKYEPKIFDVCKKSMANPSKDLDFIRVKNQTFVNCPDKSIDYAVMEKTSNGVVVPYNGFWSDVGSWESLWSSKSKDNNFNVIEGDVLINEVNNSFIQSSNRLICANDISDLIIIDTQDSLFISSKNNSSDVKNFVKKLIDLNRNETNNHRKVYRPWGYYDSVDNGDGFQVKRIFVNPGSKLSMQKHKKRAEHWIIVKGIALITCGNRVFELKSSQSTFIPKGEVHRLENKQTIPLEIIEIQTGEYLGEDDIIRLEDDYHRS